jgi:hypothetical protein
MKVVSIGGLVNTGGEYAMWLETPFSQPGMKIDLIERTGGDPAVAAARRQARTLNLMVIVGRNTDGTIYTEAERQPLREALMAALDTELAAVALVVSDNDGSHERYLYVVCQKVDEQPKAEGMGAHFAATLISHEQSYWRAETLHSETWAVTASGQTRSVTNGGSLPARPVYTFRPTDAKTGGGDWFEFKQFCAIPWYLGATRGRPVDITNLGEAALPLDTAALIIAGDMGADEATLAVVVDGVEVRRWITNYNTSYSQVWANLDFEGGITVPLLSTIGSGDVVTSIAAKGSISRFPQAGILQIGDEIFTYSSKDDRASTFGEVTRAAKGSTAAEHVGNGRMTGSAIYWIQHDIWLLYGPNGQAKTLFEEQHGGVTQVLDYDDYKPMLDLNNSTNRTWIFEEFGQSGLAGRNRTASWQPGGTPGGTATDGLTDVFDHIILRRDSFSDVTGAIGPSSWLLPVGGRIYYLLMTGFAQRWEASGQWDVSIHVESQLVVPVPDPLDVGGESSDFTVANVAESGEGIDAGSGVVIQQKCGMSMLVDVDTVQIGFDDHQVYFNEYRYSYAAPRLLPALAVYDLAVTLENTTTGQSITLNNAMGLDQQLEVDTAEHVVTLLDDGSSQYQSLTKSTRRKEILLLEPGANTLKVTETGLAGMTVQIVFEERTYT